MSVPRLLDAATAAICLPAMLALVPGPPSAGLAVGLWATLAIRITARDRRRRAAARRLRADVEAHAPALRRNLAAALQIDDYGTVTADRRRAALDAFLSATGHPPAPRTYRAVLAYLEARGPGPMPRPTPDRAPRDFELWVAQRLDGLGWRARPTPPSGDQGIDVIATGPTGRLGLQCKLHSGKVGNKAVQEAAAGAAFHGCDAAAVVATGGFTASAQALARATGVALWAPDELPRA
ncbi:MAG: restriction endonuclease [Shimia sp.]